MILLYTIIWVVCGVINCFMEARYMSFRHVEWYHVLFNLVAGPIKLICELLMSLIYK